MELQLPDYVDIIENELAYKASQIKVIFDLTEEGDTVPFIARYRKEATGNLDEKDIRSIIELRAKEENLHKAKQTAVNGIEDQDKLTDDLLASILNAKTLKEVEDIYKPYKLKKKTKAMIAEDKGFRVVADMIRTNNEPNIPAKLLEEYKEEEIIEGAIEIIAADIVADQELRDYLRVDINHNGLMVSKIKTDKAIEKLSPVAMKQLNKFDIYKDFRLNVKKVKPYQILALNRGDKLGILNVKIDVDSGCLEEFIKEIVKTEPIKLLLEAINKGFKALFKSVETEIKSEFTEKAQEEAISSFQKNLFGLLMTKPEYGKKVLAFDPAFRTGCKMAVLDENAEPLNFDKIFLDKKQIAAKKILDAEKKYNIDVIVVGNGTASNETVELIQSVTKTPVFVVNESGASVYSASDIAAEEFPELDLTDRGTISIARRYIDPLSELVKVPVQSIGVGMYQHDMPEKKLEEKLGYVVEDSVNEVGINVNTASVHVLNYISGVTKAAAKKIFKNRPYISRKNLKKQLSPKVYEQAIGFLRVPDSKEKLDNTDIHPDQYELAKYIIENEIKEVDSKMVELYKDVNVDTIKFITDAYSNIGKDPRTNSTSTASSKNLTIEDIKEGDILDGVVRNVVAFGAFVDIGIKNDGLVHVSEIANRFVSNPMDELEVGQSVKAKVVGIDLQKAKVQLSMKQV